MCLGLQKGVAGMEIILSVEKVRGNTIILFESGWKVYLKKNQNPGIPLISGTVVDREQFEKQILLQQYPSALDNAVRLLAQRARSKKEMEDRLKTSGYDPSVIELVLYKLSKEKLLDDRNFSAQWAESRMKKYGPSRIYRELLSKGISREMAGEALEPFTDEEQVANAAAFAARKLSASEDLRDRAKLFQRLSGMLIRRGYSWEVTKKACNVVLEEYENPAFREEDESRD